MTSSTSGSLPEQWFPTKEVTAVPSLAPSDYKLIRVSDRIFWLTDGHALPRTVQPVSNGLITVEPGAGMVHTGIGNVPVQVRTYPAPRQPDDLPDPDAWDDVAEMPIDVPYGELRVRSMMFDTPDPPPALTI